MFGRAREFCFYFRRAARSLPKAARARAARTQVFVDNFNFTSEDLERWRRAHEPIVSPDDPRLKRSAYLA